MKTVYENEVIRVRVSDAAEVEKSSGVWIERKDSPAMANLYLAPAYSDVTFWLPDGAHFPKCKILQKGAYYVNGVKEE